MKRNSKTFGQIKEDVREAEAIKQDFAKTANLEYRSKHNLTSDQKFYLIVTFIACAAVLGFFFIMTHAI